MALDDIISELSATPPARLTDFGWALEEAMLIGEVTPATFFSISCKFCGHDRFELFEMTRQLEGNRQVRGVALVCSGCRQRRVVFDGAEDGYDGEHGHCDFLKFTAEDNPLVWNGRALTNVRIRTCFIYNIEWEELREHSETTGRPPQNFYDWFNLEIETGGSWEGVWEWECA